MFWLLGGAATKGLAKGCVMTLHLICGKSKRTVLENPKKTVAKAESRSETCSAIIEENNYQTNRIKKKLCELNCELNVRAS